MPCYSTIQRTKMTDAGRLAEALTALGYQAIPGTNVVTGLQDGREAFRFSRERADGKSAFTTFATDVEKLQAIQRKYAEISVRAFAKRAGYSVAKAENEGTTQRLTLINRRG